MGKHSRIRPVLVQTSLTLDKASDAIQRLEVALASINDCAVKYKARHALQNRSVKTELPFSPQVLKGNEELVSANNSGESSRQPQLWVSFSQKEEEALLVSKDINSRDDQTNSLHDETPQTVCVILQTMCARNVAGRDCPGYELDDLPCSPGNSENVRAEGDPLLPPEKHKSALHAFQDAVSSTMSRLNVISFLRGKRETNSPDQSGESGGGEVCDLTSLEVLQGRTPAEVFHDLHSRCERRIFDYMERGDFRAEYDFDWLTSSRRSSLASNSIGSLEGIGVSADFVHARTDRASFDNRMEFFTDLVRRGSV